MILWRRGCEACFLDAEPCPEKVRVDALDVSDAEEDIERAISAADDASSALQSALYALQKGKAV